jgi:hypothetical protein
MENKIEIKVYSCPLTAEEEKLLEKFKELLMVKDIKYNRVKYDSSYLIRFLRARRYDLSKTYEMFVNFLNWRKEINLDNEKPFELVEIDKLKVFYPHGFHKVDKKGRPIFIDLLGEIKIEETLKITSLDKLIMYQISKQEKLMNEIFPMCSQNVNKYIGQTLTIVDVKKLTVKHLNKKFYNFVKMITSISQNYYPETLGQMFILNAGFLFKAAWTVCKAFLDKNMRKKVTTLGSDYKKQLLELVDEQNLPKFLGGSCKCEPLGCLYSNAGPWNKDQPEITQEVFQARRKTDEEDQEADNNFYENGDVEVIIEDPSVSNRDNQLIDNHVEFDEVSKTIIFLGRF